ncbi:MAG: 4-hydroxy-tetrahydrodipicolinate reductase [Candidatus Thermoplasmatota archaeon]|nr:4-hydroxy-tetrahydrodipicolinate reductase [Candidatus Thermoplasmatota archaeon]MCL5889100.1 4-hydroxy-tetrahydrodipicolinate reductase [Candidatus Thermoplasmatota archaeon]
MKKINVCIAGATGWIGKALTPAVLGSKDMNLTGAISRTYSGTKVKDFFECYRTGLKFSSSVNDALMAETDVLIDYTSPEAVKSNVLYALKHGVSVVVGTSGLTDEDYADIDHMAKAQRLGVFAAGNFAISAALLLHFSSIATKYLPSWEIIDYASWEKVDSPSGTAYEIANRLSSFRPPEVKITDETMSGIKGSRGANIRGNRVHSVRLPGFIIGTDVIFGGKDERLTMKFDAGTDPKTYVEGTLLAVRKVRAFTGLVRGLDKLLFNSHE